MTVNNVDVGSYKIHRLLETVGKVQAIHKSTKGDAIMVDYLSRDHECKFSALYNRNHPDLVVIKTEAFDLKFENNKTEIVKTKIEKLILDEYMILYSELKNVLETK